MPEEIEAVRAVGGLGLLSDEDLYPCAEVLWVRRCEALERVALGCTLSKNEDAPDHSGDRISHALKIAWCGRLAPVGLSAPDDVARDRQIWAALGP
jgi:hypothetical protein